MGLNRQQKVDLIKGLKTQFGLNQALRALDLPKTTWYYWQNQKLDLETKYQFLKKDLQKAVENNPVYGYRKLQVELKQVYGHLINHKPLKKLLRFWDLALPRLVVKPKPNRITKLIQSVGPRTNLLKAIKEKGADPFQILVTDFTWVYYHQGKERLALIGYEDYASKIVLDYAMGISQNTQLALKAWAKTKRQLRKRKIEVNKVIVHQDQGSPLISFRYVGQLTIKDRAMLSYAAKGTPGDNAAKKSFIGHFKKRKQEFVFRS